ncbi:hypothetical protein [Vibrio sp. F13]|uniref:hypothetical protein n=1 Tax=Vibrio sp. F13 TaxID=2070777 RepID=UPI0010BDBCA4|nr:hypothetical protein [Vibrio sp. F13]TKG06070.1 hypothetical protein FCV67_15940 [Vibrio sp. F13]
MFFMQVVQTQTDSKVLWSSADAFVLKLLRLGLETRLPEHRTCLHVKGHPRHREQQDLTADCALYSCVYRTDIRGY